MLGTCLRFQKHCPVEWFNITLWPNLTTSNGIGCSKNTTDDDDDDDDDADDVTLCTYFNILTIPKSIIWIFQNPETLKRRVFRRLNLNRHNCRILHFCLFTQRSTSNDFFWRGVLYPAPPATQKKRHVTTMRAYRIRIGPRMIRRIWALTLWDWSEMDI